MNLVLTVLEIVSPVFILALIGIIWVKTGHDFRIEFVTRLAMTLSIPALIFTALVNTDIDPASLTTISIAALVAHIGVFGLSWILVRVGKLKTRTFLAPMTFGNTGNLGLPLALFAFGNEGLGYAVVVFAVSAGISFTLGVWIMSGGGSLTKLVREPLVGATILGAIFMWQGWTLPKFAMNTLELLGQIAIPVMLITLGVAVARLQTKSLGFSVLMSLLKLGICVTIGTLAATFFNLDPVPFAVLVLQIATPVAVTSYLLAEKYGAESEKVAGLVVASTFLSVVYLPVLLAFLV